MQGPSSVQNPFNDEFAGRYGLGTALATLTARDGTTASVRVHPTAREVWLVFSYDDDDGGGEAGAAPGGDGIAVTLVDTTLLAGGTSHPDAVDIELGLADRDEPVVTRPTAFGAWIAALERVRLPTDVSIVERDAGGGIVRQRQLDFPDGTEPRLGPGARALRWIRLRLDLPGPLALPRGSTTYPGGRGRRV
jgi:hypothetical protein